MSMVRKAEFDRKIQRATPLQAVEIALQEIEHISEHSQSIGGKKWAFSMYRSGYEIGKDLVPTRSNDLTPVEYGKLVSETLQRIETRQSSERLKSMVVLALMRLDPKDAKTYQLQMGRTVRDGMERTGRREIVSVDRFIEIGEQLLDAGSYLGRILGICALTGRRTVEVACTAVFEKTGSNEVLFTGQAKARNREDVAAYRIPTLTEADRVIETLRTIRKDKPELAEDPEIFHSRCAKDLHQRARVFTEVYNTGAAKPKDLRPTYAEIAWLLFDERKTGKPLYFSTILGHGSQDLMTALSYDDFIVTDPNY